MIFEDKDEAVRFFMDVKSAAVSCPEVFQDVELDLKFVDAALKSLDGVWKTLDTVLPELDPAYEINNEGYVRNAKTGEVLTPEFNIDYNRELVTVGGKDREIFIDGMQLADVMFKQGEYADADV